MEPIAERLRGARLYLVCDALDGGPRLEGLLRDAIAGGVDVIQLRDKRLGDDELAAAAAVFRSVAADTAVPFFVNDRPELVEATGADGVHVGQDDQAVAAAREAAGAGALVGLSTHAPAQLARACAAQGPARPDYLSAGPVWETPTKPGRPAAGLSYVEHAAAHSTLPWFAIGGIGPDNVEQVVAAGARRAVVVRAIRDAGDPGSVARRLRSALEHSEATAV